MSPLVLAVITLVTYASRAASLVFLSRPGRRFEVVLGRMPAPIFAGLAALSVTTGEGRLADGQILCAAVGALLASPRRSLALCLAGGLAGYGVGELVF